eukprot:CAMPEP_0197298076 /NCGR_PEP_ID=MMETSP0890-20130614/42613_1 /TAXON_ID=44058 ORGANISM="Aureoumbra lagunensis, Strain CCMP1510" /NCGR_SAMPLE_ID=MMETSP0890 /ASSEMBLY_ACC=CAM_ASM_000533 /LENGTH=564 /DNA_ID=CAMNT_0042775581 /DNA_START=317 /DNA_END=2011 /DNA_ORIENTATION=+
MAEKHAMILFDGEKFRINARDGIVALRITDGAHRDWPLIPGSVITFASTVATVMIHENKNIIILCIDAGPLIGSHLEIAASKNGKTIGRATNNDIIVPDKELSRIHMRIYYDAGLFYVRDLGSTNGTYIQLTGPYAGACALSLGDHLLLGRTGLSINRFDTGLAECCGSRPRMEDRAIIVQDLFAHGNLQCCTSNLCSQRENNIQYISQSNNDILPSVTFVAVFDGHGGSQASTYLRAHLHCQVARELIVSGNSAFDPSSIKAALTRAFLNTDHHFIQSSDKPSAGSTAVCILLINNTLFCANVGDSRAILATRRPSQDPDKTNYAPLRAFPLSSDHTPCRDDEAARIRAAGGWVIHKRVMGELSVSRAFGDAELKRSMSELVGLVESASSQTIGGEKNNQYTNIENTDTPPATPSDYGATSPTVVCPSAFDDVRRHSLQNCDKESSQDNGLSPCLRHKKSSFSTNHTRKHRHLVVAEPEIVDLEFSDKDDFILLASDGLFDVFSNDEAVHFVHNQLKTKDPQQAAEALVTGAIHDRGSRDNVTVLILDLRENNHTCIKPAVSH